MVKISDYFITRFQDIHFLNVHNFWQLKHIKNFAILGTHQWPLSVCPTKKMLGLYGLKHPFSRWPQ